MKILITGGRGYFGTWLVRHFQNLGYDVDILSRSTSREGVSPQAGLLSCDLRDDQKLLELLKSKPSYDVCIHTGSQNDQFEDDYETQALLVNGLGTRNLAKALCANQTGRVIYFSTFHVYGRVSGEIHEDLKPLPLKDYGTTHLVGEIYLSQFSRSFGLPATILRITNGYGAPLFPDCSKWYLIHNDLSKMAYETKRILLQSNGLARRDFIWMGDVCGAVEQLIQRKNPGDLELFNVGSETSLSMLEIAKKVQEAYLEHYSQTIPIETNSSDSTRHTEPPLVDCTRLKQEIDFQTHPRLVEEAINIFKLLERS